MSVVVSTRNIGEPHRDERRELTIVDATNLPCPTGVGEKQRGSNAAARQTSLNPSESINQPGDLSTTRSTLTAVGRGHAHNRYREIFQYAASERETDRACMNIVKHAVIGILRNSGISAEVTDRIKSIYSTYMKMQAKGCSIQEVMDKIGLRIIVNSVPECYRVLGLLHMHFRPIPGTFDDYIANPKENGYQSLHTCVYPLKRISRKPIEFQIRTSAMHREAEFGHASHRLYKIETDTSQNLSDGDSVSAAQMPATEFETFVEMLKDPSFENNIVVYTTLGQKVLLPKHCTVKDAMRRLVGDVPAETTVTVNGQPRTVDYRLHDGDTLELSTYSSADFDNTCISDATDVQ